MIYQFNLKQNKTETLEATEIEKKGTTRSRECPECGNETETSTNSCGELQCENCGYSENEGYDEDEIEMFD